MPHIYLKIKEGGINVISTRELQMIQMLTEIIFPGANEAKVYEFIIRDMKSNLHLVNIYRKGLQYFEAEAQQKYNLSLLQLEYGQIQQLFIENEQKEFFKFLRNHTLEGLFSDPMYGGNYKAYGWRLLGFAGPRFYPPEALDKTEHPKTYYSLEGIAYDEEA